MFKLFPCLLLGLQLQGAVIFSNLGPGDTFNPTLGVFFGDSPNAPPDKVSVAVALQFSPQESNYVFTGADIALNKQNAEPNLPVTVNMSLRTDSNGFPSSNIIEQFPAIPYTSIPFLNLSSPTPDLSLTHLSSTTMPTLTAGARYWLEGQTTTGDPTLVLQGVLWRVNVNGNNNLYAEQNLLDSTWQYGESRVPAPAARINGDVVVSAVPEVSSLLLTFPALATLLLGMRMPSSRAKFHKREAMKKRATPFQFL